MSEPVENSGKKWDVATGSPTRSEQEDLETKPPAFLDSVPDISGPTGRFSPFGRFDEVPDFAPVVAEESTERINGEEKKDMSQVELLFLRNPNLQLDREEAAAELYAITKNVKIEYRKKVEPAVIKDHMKGFKKHINQPCRCDGCQDAVQGKQGSLCEWDGALGRDMKMYSRTLDENLTNPQVRFQLYRWYHKAKHGTGVKGVREPMPWCVEQEIKRAYPSGEPNKSYKSYTFFQSEQKTE